MTHKHIEHFEDLAFNPALLRSHLAEITAGNAEYSIKYDGSPAIVFGCIDGKTFVATKSYFNIEPKMFTDPYQITEQVKNPDLAQKLINVLRVLQHPDARPPEGNIYFGDLLFHHTIANPHEYVTPNVIRYNFFSAAVGKRMGVAIHEQLAGDIPYESNLVFQPQLTFTPTVFPVPMLPCGRDLQILQYRLDMVHLHAPTFFIDFMNWMIKVDRLTNRINKRDVFAFFQATTEKVMSERKTAKGKKAVVDRAEVLGVPLADIDYEVLHEVYRAVMLSKRLLLTTILPSANQYDCPSAYNSDMGWTHEGMVVKTRYGSFKAVDRRAFRKANARSLNTSKVNV